MESLYKKTHSRLDNIKNTGYDYEGKILRKSLSSYIYLDDKRGNILDEMEKILFFLIEKVKTIKTFYNYTVDKDYRKLN